MHGHGHADGSQHHGHQADQAQDRGRTVQALAQRRVAFAEVHHLRVGQRRLQLLAHRRCIRLGRNSRRQLLRQLHQQPLTGPAARRNQPCASQRRARDHHSRPQPRPGADAVRLLPQHCRDPEVPAAQPQRLAHTRIQANQKLLRHHRRIAVQSLPQARLRLQFGVAIVGILTWIDSLERNQNRHRVRRHGRHGDGLRHPGPANSLLLDCRYFALFLGCRLAKDARAQVSGHQRPRLTGERPAEAVAQSAHAHQSRHADRDRQHHKSKLARRRAQIPPTNGSSPFPAQRALSHLSPRS